MLARPEGAVDFNAKFRLEVDKATEEFVAEAMIGGVLVGARHRDRTSCLMMLHYATVSIGEGISHQIKDTHARIARELDRVGVANLVGRPS